jgi:tripartite-type tricarboxylate transporter receptor subunit TctC
MPIDYRLFHVLAACAGLVLLSMQPAAAEDYPTRPISIIVPFPPGGSSDIVMRVIAQKASEGLKQPIIIDNRAGAAGNVAAIAIKHATPDGYLLMMGHTGTHAINATLYTNLAFDPVKDFTPIAPLIAFNNILMVPKESPAKSMADLVALAKSKPEGLSYGSQGIGTGGHLLGVLFAKEAGIKLLHVPYRGISPAVTDAVAGRVDLLFSSYISAAGYVEGGQLRMLAITGEKRHPRIPDVPTTAEAGYPEVQMTQWFGLFGPAGMPQPIVDKLNAEFVKAMQSDDVKSKLEPQASVLIPGPPKALSDLVSRDLVRLGKVVKDSGAQVSQ